MKASPAYPASTAIIFSLALLTLSTHASAWNEVTTHGMSPSVRGGGQMRQVGDELVLFGGMLDCFDDMACDNVFYNDVFHFDLTTNTWSAPEVVPDPVYGVPEPRAFFGATVHEEAGALVIYGGTTYPVRFIDFVQWNAETTTFDDLWFYYPATHQWLRIITDGVSHPGRRSGAGIEIFGNQLVLSSGIDSNTFLSVEDTWTLDLDTLVWTQVTGRFSDNITNPLPFELGRYIFPFVRKGHDLYAFSGNIIPIPPLLGVQHQDLWRYDVVRNQWDEILPFGNDGFTGRVHGGAAIVANRFVVFFGDNNDDAIECRFDAASSGHSAVNETWTYKLNPEHQRQWQLVQFDQPVPPLKRIYFANSGSTERIYVWGGFDVVCPSGQPNDGEVVWNEKMYALDWAEVVQ